MDRWVTMLLLQLLLLTTFERAFTSSTPKSLAFPLLNISAVPQDYQSIGTEQFGAPTREYDQDYEEYIMTKIFPRIEERNICRQVCLGISVTVTFIGIFMVLVYLWLHEWQFPLINPS